MASATSLGRVQPLYKGTYNSTTTYQKLDNVYYNGDTWVCIKDSVIGIEPTDGSIYWQKVAGKGETGPQGITGSFGTPTATATELESGSSPTVNVVASGPDTAKVFNFEFGIPAGPKGFSNTSATARSIAAGSTPTASAELVTSGDTTTLEFEFGIPAADGTGIKSIDTDIRADGSGNAALTAVRYGSSQSLNSAQQLQARTNINAQIAGNYIISPIGRTENQFLKYVGNEVWATESVDVFPSGGSTGYVLRKTDSGTEWSQVHEVISGGRTGAVLTKVDATNYKLTWSDPISNPEIDTIMSN